jgi:starvation-inducible outer membrane lipoprotein
MKTVVYLFTLAAALLLSGCIIVIEQPKDPKATPATATTSDKK